MQFNLINKNNSQDVIQATRDPIVLIGLDESTPTKYTNHIISSDCGIKPHEVLMKETFIGEKELLSQKLIDKGIIRKEFRVYNSLRIYSLYLTLG